MRHLGGVLLLSAACLLGQRQAGELVLLVQDPAGAPLDSSVTVISRANEVRLALEASAPGRYIARGLPFGPYRVRVERSGFHTVDLDVDVRSEVPLERLVRLGLVPVETQLTVQDATLLDPHATGLRRQLGRETLDHHRASQPARAVLQLVNTQPGWLLEANGVLHPRGSEYDTQYVLDGIPILDNRSPTFAPAFEMVELDSMSVMTGGYPAEYGRKLGGVVELVSRRDQRHGFHGRAVVQGGSFATRTGYLGGQYRAGRTTIGGGAHGSLTDRFLDPPVLDNFTNTASSHGLTLSLDHESGERDRLRFYLHRKRTGFLVPNQLPQQEAGQRQDRASNETLGTFSWQRVLSPRWLLDVRGMGRETGALLWSNPAATPVLADQDRGLLEGYGSASASASLGRHAVKFGLETAQARLRERFGYRITDPFFFDEDGDPEFPVSFRFQARRNSREVAGYFQDVVRLGPVTVSAGLRWDRYRLLVRENYLSPRLGAAWHIPSAGLVFRGSYDRAVTTPALENLLLAGSPEVQALTEETTGRPLRPARGNFYEFGFAKSLFARFRLEVAFYQRNIRDYADDDVFLNTGVSFPIAFDRARIRGLEAKIDLPAWGRLSGFVSYSNLTGSGFLPVTGGLFLDDEDAARLQSTGSFPITQDQRNTVQGRYRYQLHPKVWAALGFWYNSGLPFEREDGDGRDDRAELERRYGQRVLSQVNRERGRVRPSHAFDVSLGADLWKVEGKAVTLQADALNIANRLNLINFAGLFSGTAVGAPRSISLRLEARF